MLFDGLRRVEQGRMLVNTLRCSDWWLSRALHTPEPLHVANHHSAFRAIGGFRTPGGGGACRRRGRRRLDPCGCDGRSFVPSITIGPLVVGAIRRSTAKPLNVHLMIVEPERYLSVFADAGADHLLIQAEPGATTHLHRVLAQIRALGKKSGVVPGSISKCGDRRLRTLLYEAANVMLTRYKGPLKLKDWAFAIARRSTMRKARIALARRLAIIMHAMLQYGTEFKPA
jgi:hypothetical protein